LIPDVAPMAEQLGIAGYVPTPVWYGFVTPAGTPRAVVDALNGHLQGVMQLPDVKERLTGLGAQQISTVGERFTAELKAETEKATQLARRLGTAR
jgi:tripartite-type tricarboxylate transporter receptor subunit TctC